jgi:hypothetical protein
LEPVQRKVWEVPARNFSYSLYYLMNECEIKNVSHRP